MGQPLSVLYKLMDAKGLRDWSANLLRLNTSMAPHTTGDSVEFLISSITPSDPWEFLDDDSHDENSGRVIDIHREFPDEITYQIEV